MSDKTKIEWTDATWNPFRGCARVSPGCENCYAESMAARFSAPGEPYYQIATRGPNGPRWTRRFAFVAKHFDDPIRWTKPRRVFVNSMSDTFYEEATNEQIAAVFAVMAATPRHTYQVLTKRADRMLDFFRWLTARAEDARKRYPNESPAGLYSDALISAALKAAGVDSVPNAVARAWPLPNVWLGISAEDQPRYDARWPKLAEVERLGCAAVTFVSYEPAVGPLTLKCNGCGQDVGAHFAPDQGGCSGWFPDWIIVGGESGPGSRPFPIDWAESIVAQTRRVPIACFVKQLGAVPVMEEARWRAEGSGALLAARNAKRAPDGFVPLAMPDAKGGDWSAWPERLRVRDYPRARS